MTKNDMGVLVKKGMVSIDNITYLIDERCCNCGNQLRMYKEVSEDIPPRCPAFCLECGYREKASKELAFAKEKYQDSVKAKTLNIFKSGSVLSNKEALSKTLQTFEERDETSEKAKQLALATVNEIMLGEKPHVFLTGNSGVGKTHLSVGILQDVMSKTDYKKTTLFISYLELYNQIKFSFSDKELNKYFMGKVMGDIQSVDVLVLDDIGAELGKVGETSQATEYNVSLIQRIVEARENKATIFTTNLTSKEIKRIYGERVRSRMLSNIKDSAGKMRFVTFVETKDARYSM